ncbi:LytR/AlgR family response regulator transcription factor [Flavihumibacter profundi]|jgi:two-component system, LytTR family, response regulator|uniref:LytR/AlgR family response regulator transcription factor n=1 Tax=Flavihumibacter profundi TaxID=2716883 RepID=UPI001CC3C90D|nr:LytTR family DNA-binding domain-containing protein [Flavihumibacter profundi]MBZ5858667.1 LytTR family DNA-binding domain-containing protein [Flavihumibacter profundi]
MLNCIAIDDEPLALELLEDNISKVPFLKLVAACENPLQAMRILEKHPVDLIFLDIQMPGLTGLQFIQSLTIKPLFILITAYEKYALEGYSLDVVDYLVKPVSLDRFIKACNKARELHELRSLKQGPPSENSADYFFVNVDYSLLKISFSDILWIESLKDYVKINLKSSSKPIITRMSMKLLEESLPADKFLRVHKSFIISKDQVTAVRKNSLFIGTMEIPVGENYRDTIAIITGKLS